jgi:hypothetical protein
VQVKATIRATTALAIGAVPGLRVLSRSKPSTPSSAKRRCQRHTAGATDAGAARHFRHRQSVDGEQYDFRALHVLEAVVAIADYPLEAFDVDGAREDANGLGHTPDSHVRPCL